LSPTRREFLGAVAAASVGLACQKERTQVAPKIAKKRILILGGTGFLGPKTVEVALSRGHAVTIFNRGKREKLLPSPIRTSSTSTATAIPSYLPTTSAGRTSSCCTRTPSRKDWSSSKEGRGTR
jgi:hypothetical protein